MTLRRFLNYVWFNGDACPAGIHPMRWAAMLRQLHVIDRMGV